MEAEIRNGMLKLVKADAISFHGCSTVLDVGRLARQPSGHIMFLEWPATSTVLVTLTSFYGIKLKPHGQRTCIRTAMRMEGSVLCSVWSSLVWGRHKNDFGEQEGN